MANGVSPEVALEGLENNETARPGRPQNREVSQNKRARELSPDVLPWEPQPGENQAAYAAFVKFREMERRSAKEADAKNGPYWSTVWSWGYRAYQWDLHVARRDAEELIRYRIEMNDRQRATSRVAQAKILTWLEALDPKDLKPSDAVRWFEVAVRVERAAAGSDMPIDTTLPPEPEEANPLDHLTMAEILGVDEAQAADALERLYEHVKRPS